MKSLHDTENNENSKNSKYTEYTEQKGNIVNTEIVRPITDPRNKPPVTPVYPASAAPATEHNGKIRRKRRKHGLVTALVLLFLLLILTGTAGFWYYYPSTLLSTAIPSKVLINDIPLAEGEYLLSDSALFLRYDIVKKNLDPALYWEPETSKIVVATTDKVIEMDTNLLTLYVNYEPVSVTVPTIMKNNTPYVSMDFLAPVYDISLDYLSSGTVTLDDHKNALLVMTVTKNAYLRESSAFRSARIRKLEVGEDLIVYKERAGWYEVRTATGLLGYVNKNNVLLKEVIEKKEPAPSFSPPWKPVGGKINLTWDIMTQAKQNMSGYKTIPGLNVISPTWFYLTDGKGTIKSYGSTAYTEWAHKEGLQVWALFANSFDPDITAKMLRSYDNRKKVIQQILVLSKLLKIDGINIDFENINLADKDYLSQFVRELTPLLHEQKRTVSMDVTFRSTNENWSMCFDRPVLGGIVDYMAVMAYDEHWATSPESGSVASLPWVRNGMERIFEQVPKEKVLLGVPFYSRIWEETPQNDGSVKVTSKAYSMSKINEILASANAVPAYDETTGQNYASYNSNGKTYKVWLEDETSMKQRAALVKEYGMAGIASWRKGFEEASIWDVIRSELARMP